MSFTFGRLTKVRFAAGSRRERTRDEPIGPTGADEGESSIGLPLRKATTRGVLACGRREKSVVWQYASDILGSGKKKQIKGRHRDPLRDLKAVQVGTGSDRRGDNPFTSGGEREGGATHTIREARPPEFAERVWSFEDRPSSCCASSIVQTGGNSVSKAMVDLLALTWSSLETGVGKKGLRFFSEG